MEMLNYHHLFFFWVVMNAGSIKAASTRLQLAQSTISAQISALEKTLGGKLFTRAGRSLEPTDLGHMVFNYADKIFTIGQEMMNAVHSAPNESMLSFYVGVMDVVPKLLTRKLLLPAMKLPNTIHLVCKEGRERRLFSELSVHKLDVVITDVPVRAGLSVKAYSHLLCECGVSFFASKPMTETIQGKFPYNLDKTPMLLPMPNTALRGRLDRWFDQMNILPYVVGEFDDSGLLNLFGQAGDGVFVAPQIIEQEVKTQYNVEVIGRSNEIMERFYAVSLERVIKHPAVLAISQAADA